MTLHTNSPGIMVAESCRVLTIKGKAAKLLPQFGGNCSTAGLGFKVEASRPQSSGLWMFRFRFRHESFGALKFWLGLQKTGGFPDRVLASRSLLCMRDPAFLLETRCAGCSKWLDDS